MLRQLTSRRRKSYRTGLFAEWVAAYFLRLKGYRILAQRYKTPGGEIDLIVRKGRVLIMVEVKARRKIGEALEAITPKNRARVEKATRYFLSEHPEFSNFNIRFDAIAFAPPFHVHHLDNAWEARS